jgi:uncharacterized damage-inducible protein DinB
MDLIDRLLEHDRWATIQLLEISCDLSDAQLDQEFDIGLRTLRTTFDHLIFNIDFWTCLATGQPTDGIERDKGSITALTERHERSYDTFAGFARRMRDEGRLEETFVDHFGGKPTFGGIIIHVVMHNDEHRTEAPHILQRLGVPDLPEVDHALWDQSVRRTSPA